MTKRLILGLTTAAIAMTASAQTTVMQPSLSKPAYQGRLGLQHIINPSDAQLREVGKRVSSIPMPTKAQTAKMIKKAMATAPSKARSIKSSRAKIEEIASAASYTSADTLMWASWEDWNGEFNWVPSNWKRFSNFNEETYIIPDMGMCPTWMAYESDGYYMPYATDGSNIMMCMYGEELYAADSVTVIAPAPKQDEWLVSPTASSIESTTFLSFDLAYSPLYTHLFAENGEPVIDMNRIAYDVEALVTTSTRTASNDESIYTRVFKLSDIVDEMMKDADLTDSATVAQFMNMKWHHYRLPLEQFAGGNVRIAFRYKGEKGGAVLLDAVRVSDMLPVAKFDRPEGSFYLGFSDDARVNYSKHVLMPAYVPSTWTNYCNEDVDSYAWNYDFGGMTGSSEEKDLILESSKPGVYAWPALKATSGARSDEYKGGAIVNINGTPVVSQNGVALVGGNAIINYGEGVSYSFALGNFDPTKQYWLGQLDGAGTTYAFGTGSGAFWAEMTNYRYNAVSGIANVYDAPASPYVFTNVTLPLGNLFNLGAEIICTVYKAKDLGNGGLEVTDEVLGQTSTAESIKLANGDVLSFNFPNIMIIDSPIAIKISGFDNPNLLNIAPLTQALNHDNGKGYAFVLLKNQTTGGEWWCEIAGALSALEGPGNMEVSHCIGMNAVFPYLHSNDGDVFQAANEGETKAFDIDSYWYPEKVNEQDVLNGWTIEVSEPWVKVEKSIDIEAQKAGVKVTAEALPEGTEGRSAIITIKSLACEETITVVQGNTTAIGNLTINAANAASGIYSISGQRVNAANAKNGIFIEKRNGRFVKVIK